MEAQRIKRRDLSLSEMILPPPPLPPFQQDVITWSTGFTNVSSLLRHSEIAYFPSSISPRYPPIAPPSARPWVEVNPCDHLHHRSYHRNSFPSSCRSRSRHGKFRISETLAARPLSWCSLLEISESGKGE